MSVTSTSALIDNINELRVSRISIPHTGRVVLLSVDDITLQFHTHRGVTPHDVACRLRELADEIDGWSTDLIVCQGCGQELAAMSETCMCPVGDLIRLKEPA